MKIAEIKNQNSNQPNTKKKGLAIASLVCAIIGGYISTISIVAIVFGHVALNKIKKDPSVYNGRGLAIAGLILGYLGLAIGLFTGIMKGVVMNKLGY